MERAIGSAGVVGRYLAVDERGRGLRATWRPGHGFTNVSLWQGDVCVETFHLSAHQMGELIAFLGMSLGACQPKQPSLRIVDPSDRAPLTPRLRAAWKRGRLRTAGCLETLAARLRLPD